MKISCIVASYNNEDTLERAIRSIRSESEDIEIIVVDDNSQDSTPKLLENFKKKYRMCVISNVTNLGPSTTRNRGINASKGDLLTFLDADDYWLKDRLAETTYPFEKNQEIDVVYADAYMEYQGELSKTKQSDLMSPPDDSAVLEHLFRRNYINMCAVTIKQSVAKKIMFDEKLRSAEDYDFWLRVSAGGASFCYVDKPLVAYAIHGSNLSGKRLLSIDSTLAVLDKNSRYAVSSKSKENLRLHRQSLLEDKLKLQEIDILKTLNDLTNYRNLGKRERLVRTAARFSRRTGRYAKRKLIK